MQYDPPLLLIAPVGRLGHHPCVVQLPGI
jgi:hypothetical protein